MTRLYPAETRLKEGAHAHDSDQTGGSVPLPRVGGALSARSWQYQEIAASLSNAAKLGNVARGEAAFWACLGNGGRTWWAHFEFTRMNTTPTFHDKKIEDAV